MQSQRTYDVIITSLLRQNEIATSFWRNNGLIITSCAHWECADIRAGRYKVTRFLIAYWPLLYAYVNQIRWLCISLFGSNHHHPSTSPLMLLIVFTMGPISDRFWYITVCLPGFSALWITSFCSTIRSFVRGVRLSPVDSPHKGLVMRKVFPCHDVTMVYLFVSPGWVRPPANLPNPANRAPWSPSLGGWMWSGIRTPTRWEIRPPPLLERYYGLRVWRAAASTHWQRQTSQARILDREEILQVWA